MFNQVKGGMFSLLENKRLNEWYTEDHDNDIGAISPNPWNSAPLD